MIKKILSLALVFSLSVSAAEQAITQWVYNTLERAQANLDKGNLEAAERIYYDYANDTWSSRSYDHFVILRTYAYFLLSYDRNDEALRYLKQASLKRDMPPYDIFELHFTLGQVYYVTGDRENAKKTRVKPENTWGFPGIFGCYPHWTLEIVVGHCQAFLIAVQPA